MLSANYVSGWMKQNETKTTTKKKTKKTLCRQMKSAYHNWYNNILGLIHMLEALKTNYIPSIRSKWDNSGQKKSEETENNNNFSSVFNAYHIGMIQ